MKEENLFAAAGNQQFRLEAGGTLSTFGFSFASWSAILHNVFSFMDSACVVHAGN